MTELKSERHATESIERCSHNHEDVALDFTDCRIIFVCNLVRSYKQAKPKDADNNPLSTNLSLDVNERSSPLTSNCVHRYFGRMYTQEKNIQTGIAQLCGMI